MAFDDVTKRCPKCKTFKSILMFFKDKHTKDSLACWCKNCVYEKNRKWKVRNLDKCIEYSENFRKRNPETIKMYYRENRIKMLEKQKIYQEENREKCQEKARRWAKNNPDKVRIKSAKQRSTLKGKLNMIITAGVYKSLHGTKNGRKWESLLGYNYEQLKKHLEKQFTDGMSWGNIGLWHVDHKIPISAFNFEKPEDLDFKRCWTLKNLQPLWARENLRKNDKLSKPFQPSLTL